MLSLWMVCFIRQCVCVRACVRVQECVYVYKHVQVILNVNRLTVIEGRMGELFSRFELVEML